MRKSTKLLSLLLAVLLTVSCFSILSAVPVSAAEGEQKVYFDFPTDGTWGDPSGVKIQKSGKANVYCYAYPVYGNVSEFTVPSFGGRITQCTSEGNNVYSFDLSAFGNIDEGADYGIIFSTAANGGFQTVDLTMTAECIGDHVIVTPYEGVVSRENSQDSHKVDHYAAWTTNTQCGPKATISSLGQLMPGLFPFYQPKAQQLSNALKGYLINPVNNAFFQYDNNMTICQGLGVTPQDVYDQYMADNADFIEAYGDDVQTSEDIPCPFLTDGTTKIPAPAYVAEVLGVQGEEPTTEEPTTEEPTTEPPYVDVVDSDTGITVNINNPNATLSVDVVTSGADYDGANAALAADGKQIVAMYDINLTDNGVEYQPEQPVTVKIPSDTEGGEVYRYADGTLTNMNAQYADGAYEFAGDHFSLYLVAEDIPVPSDVYSVIGSSDAVFGGVWWAQNPDCDMTYDPADGLYKRTYTGVEPQKMLQLKVIKDHDEYQCWPNTGGNYTFDVNSLGDLTVTFDPATGEINVLGDITVVTSIEINNVIAAGNGEDTYLNGVNWDPSDTSNAMTEIEPGLWEITMEDIYAFDNYNIKFAANSVDDDGNPVSNPWGVNWGSEKEQLYPTGEPIPAVFNGKNCIFEVEEDESTVTIQLDLRNFDYQTKEGATFTITVTPPEPEHVHTPGAATQENVVPADCTNGGSYDEVIKCTECGEEISRTHKTTDALGHVPGTATQENVVPADCTHGGSYDEVVKCTRCKDVISTTHKTTDALGHDLQYVAKVPATVEQTGTRAHYVCSRCEKLFSDAEGKNEVTAESLVIPVLGPDDLFTVNAISNLFTSGSKTYTDSDGNGVPDTVTIMYYADITGLRLQATQFAILYDPDVLSFDPAKNGEWDEDIEEYDYTQAFPVALGSGDVTYVREGRLKFAVANYSGFALKKNGKLVPIAKIVFDIAEGSRGTTDVEMEFGVMSFVNTKTEDEYIVYSEANGLNQENYDYISTLGSLFTVVDHRPVVDAGYDATCTETGLTEGSHCELCGEVIKAQEVIPAKGHTAVNDPKVDATCTETGLTAGVHCSVCNAIMLAQRVIPAKGHTEVTDPAVPATCTETGLTAGSHCSVCHEVIVAQQTVPALGHDEVTVPGKPATYTETGLTNGVYCNRCKEWVVPQQIIPILKSEFMIGDINRDRKVDVLDALMAQKYSAEKVTLDAEQLYIGDVNNDGAVDALDAVLIQKYAAERINSFPKKA